MTEEYDLKESAMYARIVEGYAGKQEPLAGIIAQNGLEKMLQGTTDNPAIKGLVSAVSGNTEVMKKAAQNVLASYAKENQEQTIGERLADYTPANEEIKKEIERFSGQKSSEVITKYQQAATKYQDKTGLFSDDEKAEAEKTIQDYQVIMQIIEEHEEKQEQKYEAPLIEEAREILKTKLLEQRYAQADNYQEKQAA